MPADPRRVKELFAAALDLPAPTDRAAFLDRECGDPDLRLRLDALLRAHDHPESALDRPLASPAATGPFAPAGTLTPNHAGRTESAGTLIAGRYKLLESIGEGGMGEVWVADQLEPIRRRVALKLIKPGMDSKTVLARFEAERQALALMDHPNIAKVLDAGTTEDGRPYFVMELVKGTPMTEFCDARKLTPRERLELFVPVCQAIQHAHQKGIIHRDVKPSNVLVALHDEKPVPKVIDFGVAKAVGQQLTEKTVYTGFGALIGTPAYMAPEQATFNQLDIDTRADVYALGVLLYELLAGSTPFEPERLRKAALDEVLRLVREEEPPRPSARLSTSQARATIAAVRQSDPDKLAKLVRGELDWIVMKALEKDRTRRYDTAIGLARDVERYLKDEPVEACPPTLSYRLRKVMHRHRGPVAAAVVVAAALIIGIAASVWQATRARSAEQIARDEAAHAFDAEDRTRTALSAEKTARDELKQQFGRVVDAEKETATALRRSEGLRLATTALLKKPQNHDLAAALANEAVFLSRDAATVGTAIAAVQGLSNPRPFQAATIQHPKIERGLLVRFLPSPWFWYHPDGRHILALNNEHNVVVTYDAATLKPVRDYPVGARSRSELVHLLVDPRGRWLVGIDAAAGLTACDIATGAEVGRTQLDGGAVWGTQFNAARDLLATIGQKGKKEIDGTTIAPHRLVVFAMPNFEKRFEFEASELFGAVAFSRDGGKVAVSSTGNRIIRVWDLTTKALLLEEKVSDGLPWPALVFSHDGTKLLDMVREGVAVWDIATRKKQLVVPDEKMDIRNGGTISTDADGTMVLVHPTRWRGTLNSRHTVGDPTPSRVFDLKELRWGPKLEPEPDNSLVVRCELSPDGKRAVGLVGDHGVVAWEVSTGRRIFRGKMNSETMEGLAISPDGRSAVTDGMRDQLSRWDFDDRGLLPAVEFPRAKDHVLVCDTGRRVVVFRGEGRLESLNAADLRSLDLGPLEKFPWTQNGHSVVRVVADGRRVLWIDDRKREGVLFAASGEEIARYGNLPNVDVGYRDRRRVLTTRSTGRRFLLPAVKGKGEDVFFRAYDAETGRLVSTIDLGNGVTGAWHYTLSADGRRLAVVPDRPRTKGPRDTSLEVWNLDTGGREGTIPGGEAYADGGEAFGPDGSRLVVWRGGRASVWDAETRTRLREFKLTSELIEHAALSRNGRYLATDTKTELALWDADTGTNVYRMTHPERWCDGLAFVAGDAMLMVDSSRSGWSALDLFPTDLAAHLKSQGVRRLSDRERKEFGVRTDMAVERP